MPMEFPARLTTPAILVVDDDPFSLRLVAGVLTEAGYRVDVALGVDDAQRKLRRQRFDLALVELAMKRVSGIHLIELLKGDPELASTPVLALTTPIRPDLASPLGCDGFVFRPVDSAALLRCVRQLCGPTGVDPVSAASGPAGA